MVMIHELHFRNNIKTNLVTRHLILQKTDYYEASKSIDWIKYIPNFLNNEIYCQYFLSGSELYK